MKPYYKNHLTTIYNDDCLRVMNELENNSLKFKSGFVDKNKIVTYC